MTADLQPADTANSTAVGAELFQSTAWFRNLADSGFADKVRTIAVAWPETDSGVQHILILMRRGTGALAALGNYYTPVFGPLTDASDRNEESKTPLEVVLRSCGRIDLQPLPQGAPWVSSFQEALRRAGFWFDRYFCFGNWYLQCPNLSFERYIAERPSPLRNSIERGKRRLAKAGAWNITIHQGTAAAGRDAVAAFVEVYNASWKQPEPNPRFIPALIETAAREGWLRLGILRLDGRPIAAQLWLVHAGKANIYKLAYVEGFERFSPGSVLTAAMMEHVLEVDRVHEVDYGMGDEPYKRDWMSHRRERVGLIAFNPRTVRGLSAAIRHFGGRWVRQLIQPRQGG